MSLHFRNGNLKFEKGMCQHKVAKKLFQFTKKKKKIIFFSKEKGKKNDVNIIIFPKNLFLFYLFGFTISTHNKCVSTHKNVDIFIN